MKVDTPLHATFVVEADELTSQRDADVNAIAVPGSPTIRITFTAMGVG